MSQFSFSYPRRYYLTHPLKLIEDVNRNIKWSSQRVIRGWDDRVVWSIDIYLGKNIPVWLRQLKEDKAGVPIGETEESWDQKLDIMIEGFEAALAVSLDDLPIFKEMSVMMDEAQDDPDFQRSMEMYGTLYQELGGPARYERELRELDSKFKYGAQMFIDYFFNLWD